MKNKLFITSIKYILIIILIFVNYSNNSILSFSFPTATTLNNGNILVIHKTGIDICDSTLSTIVRNIKEFSAESEQISSIEKSAQVSIAKYDDGYIVSIIINTIYFFNEEGYIKKNKSINNALYYSLSIYKYDSDYHYFLVGYIYEQSLNLYYYKFSPSDGNIFEGAKLEGFQETFNSTKIKIQNKGLSCQILKNNNNNDCILCLYDIYMDYKNFLFYASFSINGQAIIHKDSECKNFFYSIDCIKSSVNSIFSEGLFCYYFYNSDVKCELLSFINEYNETCDNFDDFALNKIHGLKVEYYAETNIFLFGYLNQEGGIIIGKFEDDTEYYDILDKYNTCIYINGYSLLYLNINRQYYILSNSQCEGIEYTFDSLLFDEQSNKDKKKEEEGVVESEEEEEVEKEVEGKVEKEGEIEEELGKVEEEGNLEEERKIEEEVGKVEKEGNMEEVIKKEEEGKVKEEEEVAELEEENEEKKEIKEEEKEDDEEEIINIIDCKELENCKSCDEFSLKNNLCLECNHEKGYYELKNNQLENGGYKKCINNTLKYPNYYFDKEEQSYKKCFQVCATCEYGGNEKENNCTSCGSIYIKNQDLPDSLNCMMKCNFFYYYTKYNIYTCTDYEYCPKDFNKLIKEKGKCIDDCKKDNVYKYQYNGKCFKKCPNDTKSDNDDYICKDINLDICKLSQEYYSFSNEKLNSEEIEIMSKSYATSFNSTDNHVSIFTNNIYSFTLYKDNNCIYELKLTIPEIDFGDCYDKIKSEYKIDSNLIIGMFIQNNNNDYYFFNPNNGDILDYKKICNNTTIIVKEDLFSKIDNSKTNINSILYLTEQNINVFNITNVFYTDICFKFDSPIDKDIALKDRVALYYPNITLCENGCQTKGVNLTSLRAICNCKLNDIMKKNIFENNAIYQSTLGNIEDIISKTNIEVVKCFKEVFTYKYAFSSIGLYVILVLLISVIILTIIYFKKTSYKIQKYIYDITEQYLFYLSTQKNNIENSNNNSMTLFNDNNKGIKNEPLKRKKKKSLEKENNKNVGKNKKHKKKRKTISFKYKKYTIFENNKNPQIKNYFIHNNIINNFPDISNKQSINELSPNSNEQIIKYKLSNRINLVNNNNRLITSKNEKLNIEEYLITDIDDLDYEDIIKKEKRKMCVYFCEKLNNNQIMLNTFCVVDHLRPRTIKIILFIVDIDLYLFVNALFFNEDYISEVFHLPYPDNFFTFIPRSVERFFYTSLVGVIVGYVIDFFFIEEKKIKKLFKLEKENLVILRYEITQIIKSIQKRNKWFIGLSFVIITFTAYYIFCFNNIYPHMRNEWIKSSIMIIILMQILSILACLLETIIRYISFKFKSEKLYKLSLLFS